MSTQPNQPGAARAENERFQLALRVVSGDLPPTTHLPFGHPDTCVPDQIDKRVILNNRIWVDRNAHRHRLEHMSPDYRANVLTFLQCEAPSWAAQAKITELWAAMLGVTNPKDTSDHLEVLELLTPGWTDHTPLGWRLHELNHTRPNPLAPPRTRVAAQDSDEPDVLRDNDTGLWQVTTQSGTTYRIDLDQRRIIRLPPTTTVGGNGHRPSVPVNRLPFDGAWVDLDCLIQCRTGTALIAFDHRHSEHGRGGYRISTDVIAIQRAEGKS